MTDNEQSLSAKPPQPDRNDEQPMPTKKWSGPRNRTATRKGGGLQIIGAAPREASQAELPTESTSADSAADDAPSADKEYKVRELNPTGPAPQIVDTTESKVGKGIIITGQW